MKKLLWILTIVGSVITGLLLLSSVLAANDAPLPAGLPPAGLAQAECACRDLKVLQIELRNALRLQQAFSNKIAELRTMNGDSAQGALKVFAEGEARRGLEPIPDYKGPSEFDYSPWGENQRTFNFRDEKLCGLSDSAKEKLDQAVAASACDGIGKALRAHEEVHGNMCRSVGYKAYLGMHGADRAREEVEAYEAQIAVLRAEIARVLKRNCGYKATGMYAGVVCSLEKPFALTLFQASGFQGHPKFTPDNSQGGSIVDNPVIGGLQWEDRGTYTVEEMSWGPDIVMRGNRCRDFPRPTGRLCTPYTNLRIALLPLETGECKQ